MKRLIKKIKLIFTHIKKLNQPIERVHSDFGKHTNDFEISCCFRDQIAHIGEGTLDGNGEYVKVKMQSGKTAIYKLFSERFNPIFEDTGQMHWKYHFVRYIE
jgi:hypothetical protein